MGSGGRGAYVYTAQQTWVTSVIQYRHGLRQHKKKSTRKEKYEV